MRSIIVALSVFPLFGHAQIVDGLIGLPKAKARARMGELRTIGYNKDRMTFQVLKGVSQTLVFSADTCSGYFFEAKNGREADFEARLLESGYAQTSAGVFVKHSNKIVRESTNTTGATVFRASFSPSVPENQSNLPVEQVALPKEKFFDGPWRITVLGHQVK